MVMVVDEKIGGAILRIETSGGGYRGAIIRKGRPVAPQEDSDFAALHARLRNEAGKLHPDYLGIEGAIERFRKFFPGGFDDVAYLRNEREYKMKARQPLLDNLPLEQALQAGPEDALAARKALRTNLLHSTESARLHETLGSTHGPDFVRSAARFAGGDLDAGLAGMVAALTPQGRASWPLATYLPYLWRPLGSMFLKPEVTQDFARRIGHDFQYEYEPALRADVYRALLVLIADTETMIAALKPVDGIDVQGFIWVVGSYADADLPLLERLRASAQSG